MRLEAAITGAAWRTPLGNEVSAAMGRLWAGERAARNNPHFPAEAYPCRLAAPIPGEPAPSPHSRVVKRMGLFGMEAAREALAASGREPDERTGLFAGYGGLRAHWDDLMPALEHQHEDARASWQNGFRLFHPFWMLQHLSNNAHALLAADIGARGEGITTGGSNAGAQALAAAIRALTVRAVDVAVVLAYDSLLEPETLIEMGARGAVTGAALDDVVAPYAPEASGAVPGEAAAALVLERVDTAGDRRLGRIAAVEAADGSAGAPGASLLARLLADIAHHGVVVDGAALAVAHQDASERRAIAGCVGADAPLTAIQAATGQVGAAAALVQAIAGLQICREGRIPRIAGLRRAATGPLMPVLETTERDVPAFCALSAGAPGLAGAVWVSAR